MFTSNRYQWVLEADIEACFDNIDHTALLGRVRQRVGDKRVVTLIKAFLKAGILSQDEGHRDTRTGTPQGGILSPLLANIALSVLDEHFDEVWQQSMASRVDRARRRRHGQANYRLIRYADLCGHQHRSAYAELGIMPRVPTLLQVGTVWVAGSSA